MMCLNHGESSREVFSSQTDERCAHAYIRCGMQVFSVIDSNVMSAGFEPSSPRVHLYIHIVIRTVRQIVTTPRDLNFR